MVFFICNDCGESLKKLAVQTHSYRCSRDINVSCMDCLKDFTGQSYKAHTICITEEEKYSAKGFVPKERKGMKKQESWITTVRSIVEQKKNLPAGVMGVFEVIQRNDNIPRKAKGFMNFFQNSARHIRRNDVETAWNLIEQEIKDEKQREANSSKSAAANVPTENGTTKAAEKVKNDESPKRKLEEDETAQPVKQKKLKGEKAAQEAPQNGQEQEEEAQTVVKSKKQKKKEAKQSEEKETETVLPVKQKKQKNKKGAEKENGDETALLENETTNSVNTEQEQSQAGSKQEPFDWHGVMRNLLLSKNQMKLSKLKQKVMKRYTQLTGAECDGKFEKKFEKKIAKAGFVVENDTVRLVEA